MNNHSKFLVKEANIYNRHIALQIHALQLAAYAIESELIEYPRLPPLHEHIEDLQTSGETFLVCWSQSKIVGAISFVCTNEAIEICRLVVHPRHTRQGIATRLLAAVEEGRGCCSLITVSTAEKNIPAVRLYEQANYRIIRRWQLSDGLKLVQLQKAFSHKTEPLKAT